MIVRSGAGGKMRGLVGIRFRIQLVYTGEVRTGNDVATLCRKPEYRKHELVKVSCFCSNKLNVPNLILNL